MDEPIRYPVLTKSSKKITTCTGKSKKLNNTCKRKNNGPIYSVQIVNASTVWKIPHSYSSIQWVFLLTCHGDLKQGEVSHFNEDLVHNTYVHCTGLWNDKNMYIFHKTKQKMSYVSETVEPKVHVALLSVEVPFNVDSLQVQTGRKHDVSLDASYSCKESDRILTVLLVLDFTSLVYL